jgi:hypothetical protein
MRVAAAMVLIASAGNSFANADQPNPTVSETKAGVFDFAASEVKVLAHTAMERAHSKGGATGLAGLVNLRADAFCQSKGFDQAAAKEVDYYNNLQSLEFDKWSNPLQALDPVSGKVEAHSSYKPGFSLTVYSVGYFSTIACTNSKPVN